MTALTTNTSTQAGSRHATAARFLAALAGDANGSELLELRYRLDDGRMGQGFDSPRRLRGLATRAPTSTPGGRRRRRARPLRARPGDRDYLAKLPLPSQITMFPRRSRSS